MLAEIDTDYILISEGGYNQTIETYFYEDEEGGYDAMWGSAVAYAARTPRYRVTSPGWSDADRKGFDKAVDKFRALDKDN